MAGKKVDQNLNHMEDILQVTNGTSRPDYGLKILAICAIPFFKYIATEYKTPAKL